MNLSRPPAPPVLESLARWEAPTILVVDDQRDVSDFVAAVLEEHGHRVITANTPDEAMRAADESDSLQLLVTDVDMPEMNGMDLADWFHLHHPSVNVLFMSGNPDYRRRLSGAPFIGKPFLAIEQLLGIVRDLLNEARAEQRAQPMTV